MKISTDPKLTALSTHLRSASATGGWITINRDALAATLEISRVQLARLLSKAERKLGIDVDGDRVRFVGKSEISQKTRKLTISRILSVAADMVRDYEGKSSP